MHIRTLVLAGVLGGIVGSSAWASPGMLLVGLVKPMLDTERGRSMVLSAGRGGLENPGSFVRVHRAEGPAAAVVSVRRADGAIVVPSNARAGDPAYAEAPAAEEEYWDGWVEEEPARAGMIFADGIDLQYSVLKKPGGGYHGSRRRGGGHHGTRGGEFGAHDLHRSAVLEFGEAAQPRLAELEGGWSRAQRRFHEATVTTPFGVRRGSDGLRHERTGGASGRGERSGGRTRW